jgi:hypothetical protein
VLDADTKDEAMLSVPTFLRSSAEIVQLTVFQPESVERMHT